MRILQVLSLIPFAALAPAQTVPTAQYNNARTNANLSETHLTVANVNQKTFGKLYSRPLDGFSYALPLYVQNVRISGKGKHEVVRDVVYVATLHNTVYAFDANDPAASTPLWKKSLGTPLTTQFPISPYIQPEIGILSTPAISNDTLYAVAVTSPDQTHIALYLHALDIATGAEKYNGPVLIQAHVQSANGVVNYDPNNIVQRTGLLVANGMVYLGFADASPAVPWHGWIMAYKATNLQQQTAVYNDTPNGTHGGIWQSGRGLAADSSGYIYALTSDGDYDGLTNFSDAILKLTPSLTLAD